MPIARLPILALFTLIPILVAAPGFAQVRYVATSNGTGFYVTKDGYIVTNAHVVRGCKGDVQINGKAGSRAEIIARDEKNDLALLKSRDYAPASSYLRYENNDLKENEEVVVMGYPGKEGAAGQLRFVNSRLLGLTGPMGEPQWIQFADAAQQGNSGGPLLDRSGHVIGVITGKTRLYRKDARGQPTSQLVASSDVAVSLATLKNFLNRNRIRFATSSSKLLFFSDNRLQYDMKNTIVQLRCVTGESRLPPPTR